MKKLAFTLVSLIFAVGCARVQVSAPKEPIKVDISMRLDVYQHVEKDIDDIEDIVSGGSQEPESKIGPNLLGFFVTEAYADDGLSFEVEQAALSRRARLSELHSWLSKGVLGENKSGLVEIRNSSQADSSVQALVNAENSDRMVIYKGVANKNGTSVEEVQKLYAKRLQDDAPSGTPIEALNESSGSYQWKVK
jgi:uncharacterized protein YdbL (DUF1318 family)